MSSSQLKLIAIFTMLIDHVGAVLFPEMFIFRVVGRLAFPIFCFLLIEGYAHTSNVKHYILRLGAFALISEIPFDLAFYGRLVYTGHQNIFFTLTIGLTMVWLIDTQAKKSTLKRLAIMIGAMAGAAFLQTDYAIYGVLLILLTSECRGKRKLYGAYLAGLSLFLVISSYSETRTWDYRYYIQAFQILALIPIWFYSGKKGFSIKYVFYAFYPVHLLVLAALSQGWI